MLPTEKNDPPGSEQATGTSVSLLDRVRANEAEAWQRFVRVYSPLVYSWAKRCGLQNQDAADVLQEVFHAVSRGIGRFRREEAAGSFRAWLWTITRNKVRDHFRGGGATPVGGTDMQQRLQEIPENEPESWSRDGECSRAGLVRRAAELIRGDFEPHTWQAFWRLAVENHSARDIATELGMTVDAVYQAKARVLRRLREELNGDVG
ncbi:MAG: sigma-70 family RNA polymerase sigma factor [Planctomycetia bacterium]|nr:sigma-70 family RNA polymerase sigma factor [Planctomycetia bacterium]